jgi:protoporphyrinogen oxidase
MSEVDGPVVVVGAGIAGLAAAFRLLQVGQPITVLEQEAPPLVGGRMASVERNGFHVDLGAPLLAVRYQKMLKLIADAGIAGQVVPASDLVGVTREGRVHRGRTGSPLRLLRGGLLDPVPRADRIRVLADFFRCRSTLHPADMTAVARWDTESLISYAARRRLHPRTLEHLLDPLASILCLDKPATIPVSAAFLFLAFHLSSGGLFTSAQGSGFLPQALAAQLPITYGAKVTHVEQRHDEVLVSYSRPGWPETIQRARAAILAIPPPRLAAICPQLPTALRAVFAATTYSRVVQVTFCLDRATEERAVLLHAPRGEAPDIAGFVLQHNLSPHRIAHGRGMITTYFRGAVSDQFWDVDDTHIVDHVLAATRRLRLLPEADRHSLTVHVDRMDPGVVRRRTGEYRALAQAASDNHLARISWAGGDHFGYSTTIGSLTSGQKAADRLAATLGQPGRSAG